MNRHICPQTPVANKVLAGTVAGSIPLTLKSHQAAVVIAAPAGAKLSRYGNRMLLSDTVAAWCKNDRLNKP
jgi:hypothetical protein